MFPLTTLVSLLLLTPLKLAHGTVITSTITQSSPSSTSTGVPASYKEDDMFRDDVLRAHNFYREQHNASALVWNETSAKVGEEWGGKCGFVHSGGPTGENLAAGYANATASIDAWALERKTFNFNSPSFSEKTGHFTQLVWKSTSSVGCGRMNCNGRDGTPGWYVVCEYWPGGNVLVSGGGKGGENSEFVRNVEKLVKGGLGDTVESGITSAGTRGWEVGMGWVVTLGLVWVWVGLGVL